MKKGMPNWILYFIIISCLVFTACKKHEPPEEKPVFDLYPLKVDNEFYYKYEDKFIDGPIDGVTKGNETWKVNSETAQGNSIKYTVERKLNAIRIRNGGRDTTIISDYIKLFEIIEDNSSSLIISSFGFLLGEINFQRQQRANQLEIKKEGYTSSSSWSFVFKADSGLTKYGYYHPPNQLRSESLILIGLKKN